MYEVINCVYRDVCHAQSHGREKEELRLKFKLSAIRCAEETSNREAGRKFSVDEKLWIM